MSVVPHTVPYFYQNAHSISVIVLLMISAQGFGSNKRHNLGYFVLVLITEDKLVLKTSDLITIMNMKLFNWIRAALRPAIQEFNVVDDLGHHRHHSQQRFWWQDPFICSSMYFSGFFFLSIQWGANRRLQSLKKWTDEQNDLFIFASSSTVNCKH